jgi:hypothetical protein
MMNEKSKLGLGTALTWRQDHRAELSTPQFGQLMPICAYISTDSDLGAGTERRFSTTYEPIHGV